MILPYALRLACVCLASFFLLNLALGCAARLAAPLALRLAERVSARDSARSAALLFSLRILPAALALAAVAGLCAPSFISFENQRGSEAAGAPFLAAAALGACAWAMSLARSFAATMRLHRSLPQNATSLAGETESVLLWEGAAPFLGLAGVLRPRVVISRSVAAALDGEQLAAALRHERAHRAAGDNLKRLLLLITPEPLPGLPLFRSVDRAWARFAEWAADDRAVAGDPRRSLSLAEALVRVARLGGSPRASELISPFVPGGEDISVRVERLLNGPVEDRHPRRRALFAAAFCTPFLAGALLPGSLPAVHQALEALMH